MQLSDEAIEEFRAIWEKEFGETITKEYAAIRGQEILMLYEKLYLSGAGLKKKEELEGEAAQPETSS